MSKLIPSRRRLGLRKVLVVLLLTSGLWLFALVRMPADDAQVSSPAQDPWRRTTHGWERISDWNRENWNPLPLHPLVVASLQLLLSLLGLLILDPRSGADEPHNPPC